MSATDASALPAMPSPVRARLRSLQSAARRRISPGRAKGRRHECWRPHSEMGVPNDCAVRQRGTKHEGVRGCCSPPARGAARRKLGPHPSVARPSPAPAA